MRSKEMASASDSIAVVTGCASGVGLATARRLLDDGSRVVGVDVADCPSELEGSVDWIQGDVCQPTTWDDVATSTRVERRSGPDCLVCCAASVIVKPFLETSTEDWRRLFDVNVLGVIVGLRAVLPGMIEHGSGAIAVVCSVDSLFVEADLAAYCASKAALLQVVRSAGLEHARSGIRINAVCPGAVDTPFFLQALEATGDGNGVLAEHVRRIPTGDILQPEQVANVIRFLVSDEASGMSGAAIMVDGGLTSTYEFDGGRMDGR